MVQPRKFAFHHLVLFAAILAFFDLALFADPGFGSLRKKKLDLQIRQPAVVRLANASFALTGSADRANAPALDSLLPTLETELLSNEKSLVKRPQGEADFVIGLRITSFSIAQPQQRMVGNATYVHWNGQLHVAYQVLGRGGRVADAGNVNYVFDKDVDSSNNAITGAMKKIPIPGMKRNGNLQNPQTPEDVKQILVDELVKRIATKLGNTKQIIQVEVAGGDDHLNRAADFMEKQLWSRAIDELEKTSAFSKEESEAYRQYDLGLAHEAMSYEAKTLSDQKSNLLEAQEYYDKALEMNRKEKYFVESVARTKDALARYKAFEGMQRDEQRTAVAQVKPAVAQVKQDPPKTQVATPAPASTKVQPPAVPVSAPKTQIAKAPAPVSQPPVQNVQRPSATPASVTPPPAQAAKPAGPQGVTVKALTANDVIEMFASGVPEDQIAPIIRNSVVQFNPLDKDTAIAIARARLPVSLQNELRKKVGAPQLGPAAVKK